MCQYVPVQTLRALQHAWGGDSSLNDEPTYIQAMVRVSYTLLSLYPQIPTLFHIITFLWLIGWHLPMFFIYAIDILGAQMYAPQKTNADWADAHRYERTLSCRCAEATANRARSTGSPRNIVHNNPAGTSR